MGHLEEHREMAATCGATPKLKLRLTARLQDWRSHLELSKTNLQQLSSIWQNIDQQLDNRQQELSLVLDRILSRERVISSQLGTRGAQYAEVDAKVKALQSQCSSRRSLLQQLRASHAELTQELRSLRDKMSASDHSLDNSELTSLKSAIRSVDGELKTMNIRIGVLQHLQLEAWKRRTARVQKKAD